MKTVKFLIVLLCVSIIVGCQDDQIPKKFSIEEVKSLDVRNYYGWTVGEFLAIFEEAYAGYSMAEEPPLMLHHCEFEYPGDIVLVIVPAGFSHLERYSETMEWDLELFKKERIARIGVHVNNRPLHGSYYGPLPKEGH